MILCYTGFNYYCIKQTINVIFYKGQYDVKVIENNYMAGLETFCAPN